MEEIQVARDKRKRDSPPPEEKEIELARERKKRSTMEAVHKTKPWDGKYYDPPSDKEEPSDEKMALMFAALALCKLEREKWLVHEMQRREDEDAVAEPKAKRRKIDHVTIA